MTNKPLLNATSATLYIMLVASFMYFAPKYAEHIDSVIVPISLLSLFVLSTAVMGYCFCFESLKLFGAGKTQEAVTLFLRTVGYFALITFVLFCTLFSISFITS